MCIKKALEEFLLVHFSFIVFSVVTAFKSTPKLYILTASKLILFLLQQQQQQQHVDDKKIYKKTEEESPAYYTLFLPTCTFHFLYFFNPPTNASSSNKTYHIFKINEIKIRKLLEKKTRNYIFL